MSQFEADKLPGEYAQDFVPSLHNRATIAAGEKLFADGSLRRMCKSADQRIRAGDQEDSGFAQAAGSKTINWCIFRGICDYGDPGKGKHWQRIAALAAASAAVTFLKTVWRPTLPPQVN